MTVWRWLGTLRPGIENVLMHEDVFASHWLDDFKHLRARYCPNQCDQRCSNHYDLNSMSNFTHKKPSKIRQFLMLVVVGFSFVLAAYWSFTQQGIALQLIEWQAAIFDGYYYIKLTFLLVWLIVLIPCLPAAFALGWLCDRLGL